MLIINRNGCRIDNDIINFVYEIAAFKYPLLLTCSSFTSLEDLHNTVDVSLTDRMMTKDEQIVVSMRNVRNKIQELEDKYHLATERMNNIQAQISHLVEEERYTWEDISNSPIKKELDEAETECGKISRQLYRWKDIEKNNQNASDDEQVTYTTSVNVLGEYIRSGVGCKPQIILYNQTDKYSFAETYIHELFHAFYDANHNVVNIYIEKIEEPLVEYAMLRFVEAFAAEHPDDIEFLNSAYNRVKAKQDSFGISHYGFGATLFVEFKDMCLWEQTFYKNKPTIASSSPTVSLFEGFFANSFPVGQEVPSAQLLKLIIEK